MQDGAKAVRCIPYVSVAFFPSLKQNFIAYPYFKVSDCILEITSCDNQALVGYFPIAAVAVHLNLKSEKIDQLSHKMVSNNILNFQESTTILNASIKKSLETYWITHIVWKNVLTIQSPGIVK